MNITLSVDFVGTPDADDILAARHVIFLENQRRAALTVPGTPLPTANAANVRASYLTVLQATVTSAHLSYIQQAKSASGADVRFTAAGLESIRANLVARLNAGESEAALIADTAA